jgi:hypothetical protein
MIFQEVIKDLISKGWTQREIAEQCGCVQGNIARMLKYPEAEPKWSTGDTLLAMNKYKTKKGYQGSAGR